MSLPSNPGFRRLVRTLRQQAEGTDEVSQLRAALAVARKTFGLILSTSRKADGGRQFQDMARAGLRQIEEALPPTGGET